MRRKVQVSFTLPVNIEQKGFWWIATCPIFDVVSQGATFDEAKKNVEDALVFFLQSCIKRGTLFEVLGEAGFDQDLTQTGSITESPAEAGTVEVHVPLPFVTASQNPGQLFSRRSVSRLAPTSWRRLKCVFEADGFVFKKACVLEIRDAITTALGNNRLRRPPVRLQIPSHTDRTAARCRRRGNRGRAVLSRAPEAREPRRRGTGHPWRGRGGRT